MDGQASGVADPKSPLQPRQLPSVASQTGVLPMHIVLLVHWTQVFAVAPVVEHTGVVPVQAVALVPEH